MFWLAAGFALMGWLLPALEYRFTAWKPRKLEDISEDGDQPLPRLTVIVAALDEEKTVEQAMRTLMLLDYPQLELIAVDDRSTDSTGMILEKLACEDDRLRVIHICHLPSGWLGKNHALHVASQKASGEFILFTDADVHFGHSALQRAMRYVTANNLDHLTLFPEILLAGFWERLTVGFFGALFSLHTRPWKVADPRSGAHCGVGAFNMVRTNIYRRMGGHASLPMDVADDVKLGKLMKRAGGRSECLISKKLVRVRWVVGLNGLVHGLTKNMFAGFGFHTPLALCGAVAVFFMAIWPAIGIWHGPLGARLLCAAALVMMMGVADVVAPDANCTAIYGLCYPLAGMIFMYIIFRSMFFTFIQGGIIWRGTLYPLKELRKGVV